MGNGVNVGAAYHVFREHVLRSLGAVRRRAPGLAQAVEQSAISPDQAIERYRDPSREVIARQRRSAKDRRVAG
jgi:hypothetical protein